MVYDGMGAGAGDGDVDGDGDVEPSGYTASTDLYMHTFEMSTDTC